MKSWLIFHAFYDIGQDPEEFIHQLFPKVLTKTKKFLYGERKKPNISFILFSSDFPMHRATNIDISMK